MPHFEYIELSNQKVRKQGSKFANSPTPQFEQSHKKIKHGSVGTVTL